jgi:hypothetical protein
MKLAAKAKREASAVEVPVLPESEDNGSDSSGSSGSKGPFVSWLASSEEEGGGE